MNITKDWSDEEWTLFDNWIRGVLKSTPEVTVTFTKKDGSERVMKCTLMPEHLPEVPLVEGKTERKKTEGTVAVYDLEAKGWRSFTIKSVKQVNFEL